MNTHKLDEFRVEFDDKQFNACSTTILAKDMEDAKKHIADTLSQGMNDPSSFNITNLSLLERVKGGKEMHLHVQYCEDIGALSRFLRGLEAQEFVQFTESRVGYTVVWKSDKKLDYR